MADSAWVPVPIKQYVEALVRGDDREQTGWIYALRDAEEKLKKVNRRLRFDPGGGSPTMRNGLLRDRTELNKHIARTKADIATLENLVSDERMQEAYAHLRPEFSEAWQWKSFAAAAWGADLDYAPFRERLKQTKAHCKKIAQSAQKLADLLDTGFGIPWPSTFASIDTLLRTTDNPEMNNHNLSMWRGLRHCILGDPPLAENDEPVTETVRIMLVPGKPIKDDPEAEFRGTLQYAWGVAPNLAALLRTLAEEAYCFEPREIDAISAAISKRQQNRKTEYIRAFAHILRERRVGLTLSVKKAMAVTTTVIVGGPDLVVSYDDVRKAVEG